MPVRNPVAGATILILPSPSVARIPLETPLIFMPAGPCASNFTLDSPLDERPADAFTTGVTAHAANPRTTILRCIIVRLLGACDGDDRNGIQSAAENLRG